jgi:hypothetical protein
MISTPVSSKILEAFSSSELCLFRNSDTAETLPHFDEVKGITNPPHFVATIEPTPAFEDSTLYFPMP